MNAKINQLLNEDPSIQGILCIDRNGYCIAAYGELPSDLAPQLRELFLDQQDNDVLNDAYHNSQHTTMKSSSGDKTDEKEDENDENEKRKNNDDKEENDDNESDESDETSNHTSHHKEESFSHASSSSKSDVVVKVLFQGKEIRMQEVDGLTIALLKDTP